VRDRVITQEAFLLPVDDGERFCISRGPASGAQRGIVIHAPAFAEEMNKSRHMTARCARALATRGFAVVQVDPLGCGDSPGDFGDATWARWIDDIVSAARWACARHDGPLWLWGLRAGALLAARALESLPAETSLVVWQAVLSGRAHLTQFLRLTLAAGVMADAERVGTKRLYEELASGRSVEVAGYCLSPALASGLAAAEFSLPAAFAGHVIWLDVAGGGDATLSPAARTCISGLRAAGVDVAASMVPGPGFWQSVEIEDCPALVEATVAAMEIRDESRLRRATAVL
jgi:exosortase A-associated hydrolase 2